MARAAQSNGRREERNALVVHQARMPAPADHLQRLGITEGQWKTLVEAIWPSAKTVDGVIMAIDYCKSRQLDPFKKPVHIVPMWNSALGQEVETVWPGINDYRTTASRTGQWAGNDDCQFGPTCKRAFKEAVEREGRNNQKYVVRAECPEIEFPEWAQITVYKIIGGQRVPFVGPKVRFLEIFSGQKGLRVPNDRWQLAPWQMIEKCAEAAALRRAFPEEFAGTYTAEEMEGKELHRGPTIEATAVYHDNGQPAGDQDDPKPTRESTQSPPLWEQRGIPKEHWDEVEFIQQSIDLTTNPRALRDAKEDFVDRKVVAGWPPASLDELELRFDTAIGRLEGTDQQPTPTDGDDAGESADDDPTAHNEASDEQETD